MDWQTENKTTLIDSFALIYYLAVYKKFIKKVLIH